MDEQDKRANVPEHSCEDYYDLPKHPAIFFRFDTATTYVFLEGFCKVCGQPVYEKYEWIGATTTMDGDTFEQAAYRKN